MIHFQTDLENYKSLALTAIQEAKKIEPERVNRFDQIMSNHDSMKWFYSVIADRHKVLSEIQRRYHNHDPYIFNDLMKKCKTM